MTQIGYRDCFPGISGDIPLGALVDAGLSPDALRSEPAKPPPAGSRIAGAKAQPAGAAALAPGRPGLRARAAEGRAPAAREARAPAAGDAARAGAGVTNSDGAEASWSHTSINLATSEGFAAGYERSRHSVSVSVLAGTGTAMETDYDFSSVIHGADLDDPVALRKRPGERAVKRLGRRKVQTAPGPAVSAPRRRRPSLRP